jgi:hypothetical protein
VADLAGILSDEAAGIAGRAVEHPGWVVVHGRVPFA